MNAVEIEQAISELALQPFDAAEFPFAFLAAFGNKDTTLKRLRSGNNNASDVPGGVLQRNNIHIAVCEAGDVGETLMALRASPATTKAKAKFILATDGQTLEAEERVSGETITCAYPDFPNHFGFLLPLAGISTIKEIKDNPIDVRATGRLNKLYVELLRENPEWARDERRVDMNHFMARLVFCFFAEDTDIFHGEGLFTRTVDQYSERDGSNTHVVLSEIFRAMNIKASRRANANPRLPAWANGFPYVNGGLFSGGTEVPRFTRMARTYLLHAGALSWREINPDIFGSMMQAVADDEERGALGMHYTSVPNILKVLNPLFLDDLRTALAEAGDNDRKLLNLRKRMARIRVFDPACGSGNFLVIAYKQMRKIEAEINRRRGEAHLGSEIPLTNFLGIELRDFPAEIARLALIIAEFQCDVHYRGQKDALAEFLPLDAQNWIVCGNALRLDWLRICRPTGMSVKLVADDLFSTPLVQTEIDFENEGGETYICGNPPYVWTNDQTSEQKDDLRRIFAYHTNSWRALNYVSGWFLKLVQYNSACNCRGAFVAINTICQGQHAAIFWPIIYAKNNRIYFAHESFKWKNLASNNAGVTVVIIGLASAPLLSANLFSEDASGQTIMRKVDRIGPYLVPNVDTLVVKHRRPISDLAEMVRGNMPYESGYLMLSKQTKDNLACQHVGANEFLLRISGSSEIIDGLVKYCIWIEDSAVNRAKQIPDIQRRLISVQEVRAKNSDKNIVALASTPHRFREMKRGSKWTIAMPAVSSETRQYLPAELLPSNHVISNRAYGIYDGDLYHFSLLVSSLHIVWVGTVCGRLELRYSYTNMLGWNTFPVPLLTEKNKADLIACAENILLAREAHFPATIGDLYNPQTMPENLRRAHDRNDEILERIYIGRRFKNDTERLEKLFELYTKMTAAAANTKPATKTARGKNTS
ncbi:DNA methyltransferase [Accumulibacter sp.]|uniref:class I SAM-dependent DNA methyltransferase n=1 Tax=Accumulibacter sp. TaxID=2053492 RepID=UPI0025F39D05|nr:DNA methyltransferase [Accumulibacter sp.]MCP5227685.1 class I SAM-dependent DNA methyltransferase [Accumulibacter sp.]